MSIWAVSQNEPTKYGAANESDFPLATYLSETWGGHRAQGMTSAAVDLGHDLTSDETSPTLSPEELQAKYPATGLAWDHPMKDDVALGRFVRHQTALRQAYYSEGVSQWAGGLLPSLFSPKSIAGFATGFAADLTDPLTLATMFVPVAGEFQGERMAANGAIQSVMRKALIKDAWIPFAERWPLAAPRVVNNMVQGLAMSAPGVVRDYIETGEVDKEALAKNVIGGALVAEGFHHLGTLLSYVKSETMSRMMGKAIDDFANDRPVNVEDALIQDKGIVEAALREANPEMPEDQLSRLTDQTVEQIQKQKALEDAQAARSELESKVKRTETGMPASDPRLETPEQVAEYHFPDDVSEADTAKLEKEVQDLQKSIGELTPEQEQILKAFDEQIKGKPKPVEKPPETVSGAEKAGEPKIPQSQVIDSSGGDLIKSAGNCIMRNL